MSMSRARLADTHAHIRTATIKQYREVVFSFSVSDCRWVGFSRIQFLGDDRPRGEATLKACVTVSLRMLLYLPHEYSLPESFTANWEQVLSRHRNCQVLKDVV